jgi:exosortase A-associated hydrolase 1
MSTTEKAILFACGPDTLVGIVGLPPQPAQTGVVIAVGGPQYRAGSHRQFVLLARKLTAAGYAVLRFDYRGMGDSTGPSANFMAASPDIGAAIDALQTHAPQIRHVVLWGLCDAASAALMYVEGSKDPRVSGLCLLNPWVRSNASLARTQVKHYYAQRLLQRAFWVKLLSGKVALNALAGLARNVRAATAKELPTQTHTSFQDRMATAWLQFGGPLLLVLSGEDYTAKEFIEYAGTHASWAQAFQHPHLERHDLPTADHTFSAPSASRQVEDITVHWLHSNFNNPSPNKPHTGE